MHAALPAYVFAEDEQLGVDLELVLHGAPDGRKHVAALQFGRCRGGRRDGRRVFREQVLHDCRSGGFWLRRFERFLQPLLDDLSRFVFERRPL